MKKWTDADMLAFANKMFEKQMHLEICLPIAVQEDIDNFKPEYSDDFQLLRGNRTGDVHGVKRLSDGEVFMVGDEVTYQNLINVDGDLIWIPINYFTIEGHRVYVNSHYKGYPDKRVADWIKRKHKPYTLKTEDGVALVEGDRCYQVSKGQCYVTWMVARPNMKNGNEIKYFAFEANAQKYADTFKLPTDHIHDLIKKLVRSEVENQLNGTKKTD